MAALILPRRFTSQPQGPVPVDWSNPITQGLIFAWGGWGDAVSGQVGSPITPATGAFGSGHLMVHGAPIVLPGTPMAATSSLTMLALITYPYGPADYYSGIFGKWDGLNNRRPGFGGSGMSLTLSDYAGAGDAYVGTIPGSGNRMLLATHYGGTTYGYIDGVPTGTDAKARTWDANSDSWYVGAFRGGAPDSFTSGVVYLAACYTRGLSAVEVASLTANPWQLFKAPPRRFWVAGASGGAVTGTAATSQQPNSVASSGAILVSGTAASLQTTNAIAVSGAVAVSGTIAATQQPNTAAVSGAVTSGVSGTAAATQQPNTSSATGAVAVSGTSSPTQGKNTAATTGAVLVSGAAGATQQPNTASASGSVISGVSGSAALTQALNTSSAAGAVVVSGTSAATQASSTSSATGAVLVSGAEAATQQLNTVSASGNVISGVSGTAATTQAKNTSSAAGTVLVSGTATTTQAKDVSAASGTVLVSGTAAATQQVNTASVAGSVQSGTTGTVAATQALNTASATGSVLVSGAAAIVETKDTGTGAGAVLVSGTAALSESPDMAALAGSVVNGSVVGSAALIQAANTFAATNTPHATANQQLLVPTPVATATVLNTASSSTTFVITQFYLIGAMSVSQVATIPPITQYARASTGVLTAVHWLVGYEPLGDFVQTATVTSTRTAAATQTLDPFTQVMTATVATPGAHASASQSFAVSSSASAISILNLTTGQIVLPFGTLSTASTTDRVLGVQTLPAFGQLATIPGYAAFVANARTYQPPAQVRTRGVTPEQRTLQVS